MAKKKKLLVEDGKYYCQCCGGVHNEDDSLLVCLKCFREMERHVRVDKLRKAYMILKMEAAEEGIDLENSQTEFVTITKEDLEAPEIQILDPVSINL